MDTPSNTPIVPATPQSKDENLPVRDLDFAAAAKELTQRIDEVKKLIDKLDEAKYVRHSLLDMEVSI